ncbi:MAG: LuxR family transcriptional regulator, partial [Chloroflexi bacterium]|nr:LuxR family transcriptional regulator [Chloroflexota bacterium]
EAEVDNFRAALAWSLLDPGCLEAGLRLAASLARFWFLDGYVVEGNEWLEKLLAQAPVGRARGEALSASGFLLLRRGEPVTARPLLEEAVALARALGDKGLLTFSLLYLGELHVQFHDLTGAHAALEESLALTREAAAPSYLPPYRVLYNLGELAEVEGDWDTAVSFYEQSLRQARARQDGFCNVVLRRLGQVAMNRDDLVTARTHLYEALVVARDWGNGSWSTAPALAHLACLETAEARPQRALCLAAAAIGLREKYQARPPPTDAARLETVITSARAKLGEAAAANARAHGHALTFAQAVAYALDCASNGTTATRVGSTLSPRETEVAALLSRCATNREIASRLIISQRTAKRHVENILLKLGMRSRAQIADWAREQGLLAAD